MRPLTRDQARALDARAQQEFGLPADLLMENAGRAIAEVAGRLAARRGIGRIVVVAGSGNNGGDGYVAARHLLDHVDVHVVQVGDPAALPPVAQTNGERWSHLGGRTVRIRAPADVDAFASDLERSPPALVVDALFGTGLSRPIDGVAGQVIDAIERARLPVVAVDLPSGLDADTGAVLGHAITATVTVTFVAPKVGFGLGEGPLRCGDVHVAEIGFPPERLSHLI
ncbi:MAG: NAD(P)H-hydrate epimerase [Planctomycetes bacterium]|nr:NAD(P)H-hydrate epimerase [Planctomycetota bacterium]